MTRTDYRPDIDGLRAVAVITVIFFHAGFSYFSSGFIGVDVFFVISGFLITQLICSEFENGTFSYAQFYLRRARRLLPALFFIYILCYIFAYLLFTPVHFQLFGESLLASVFSVSNIYFWERADYFDIETIYKPLLHTWSLSVEEQFYLLWPVSLVFLFKRKKRFLAPLIIIIAGAVSLALNQQFGAPAQRSLIFYLIPFRVFEFCVGALMVWLAPKHPRNAIIKGIILEPLLLLGLGMILYAAMAYTRDMDFTISEVVIPCVGTALVIYSGTAKYTGRLLSNRFMVFIGLISYSLYLTHWPAIVFYKYYRFDDISTYETWGVLTGSFLLSVAMYYGIERPWRKGRFATIFSPRGFAACFLVTALVIAGTGYYTASTAGLPKRAALKPISEAFVQAMQYKSCDNGYGICDLEHESMQGQPDFIMIGDSHVPTMSYLFGAIAAAHGLTIETHPFVLGIYDNQMPNADKVNALFDSAITRHIRNVMMVGSWNSIIPSHDVALFLKGIKYTITKLKAAGINVYVYGSMPYPPRDPTTCFERPFFPSCEEWVTLPDYDTQVAFNQQLKTMVLENGAKYFDLFALLCKDGRCRTGYEGMSLYNNIGHLKSITFGAYAFMKYGDPKKLDFDKLFRGPSTPASEHSPALPLP